MCVCVCSGVFYIFATRLHSSAPDLIATYPRSAFQQAHRSPHCKFELLTRRGSKPIMSDHRLKWTQSGEVAQEEEEGCKGERSAR